MTHPLKNILKNNKNDLEIILLSLGLIIMIILSQPLWKKPAKEIRKASSSPQKQVTPTPKPAPIPKLSFTLQEKDYLLEPATSFTLNIAPQEKISASVYRLEVFFNPQILEVEKITPGNFFKNPQILRKEIDNEKGKVDFSLGIDLNEAKETGEPESQEMLASISFKVKPTVEKEKISSTIISFGKNTTIFSQKGEFKNTKEILSPIILQSSRE